MAELFFAIYIAKHASMLRSALFVGARRVGRNRRVRAFVFALAGCAFAAQGMDLQHFGDTHRRKLCKYVLADAAAESALQRRGPGRMRRSQSHQQSVALDFGSDLFGRRFRSICDGANTEPDRRKLKYSRTARSGWPTHCNDPG